MRGIHYATNFELAIRFHCWAQSLQKPPHWIQIVDRFAVSRATAYRYLSDWRAALAKEVE